MEKKCIFVYMKQPNGDVYQKSFDVKFEHGESGLKKIGNTLLSIFPDRTINIGFEVYSEISDTWMRMSSYYANEKRFVKH